MNFIHYAGSWAVPILYDISDDDLYTLLDQINGVLFTGGGTDLIDMETGEESQYYQTTKKIWEYSIRLKDEENVEFPIFGIC